MNLSGEMVIDFAHEILESFKSIPEDAGHVVFEASSLERIDLSGLQIITGFVRDASSRGVLVQWQLPPESVFSIARLLGMESLAALTNRAA